MKHRKRATRRRRKKKHRSGISKLVGRVFNELLELRVPIGTSAPGPVVTELKYGFRLS